MNKPKPTRQPSATLSGHRFDTSGYIVMDGKVTRDSVSGRLVQRKPATKAKAK